MWQKSLKCAVITVGMLSHPLTGSSDSLSILPAL
jgi:hypothetical protein